MVSNSVNSATNKERNGPRLTSTVFLFVTPDPRQLRLQRPDPLDLRLVLAGSATTSSTAHARLFGPLLRSRLAVLLMSVLTTRLGSRFFLLGCRLTRLDALDHEVVKLRDRVGRQGINVELNLVVVL